MLIFEKFSLYGFSVEYPNDWEFEMNPKSRRNEGDIVFKSKEGTKIFLSWGELDKIKKKCETPEIHSKLTLKKLEKVTGVKSIKILNIEEKTCNDHKTSVYHVMLDTQSKFSYMLFANKQIEIIFTHIHCGQSNRYFSIYSHIPYKNQIQIDIFNSMLQSFKCH